MLLILYLTISLVRAPPTESEDSSEGTTPNTGDRTAGDDDDDDGHVTLSS